MVNAAINLFAICLPLQTPKVQESILEQVSSFLSANSLQRDPARKAAMIINIALALLSVLKVAVKETRSASGDLKGSAVEKVMQDLIHVRISSDRPIVHHSHFSIRDSSCTLTPTSGILQAKLSDVSAAALVIVSLPRKSIIS